jgi:hypothetical protein
LQIPKLSLPKKVNRKVQRALVKKLQNERIQMPGIAKILKMDE